MKQNIVAVIVKIDFGAKSGVDQKKYLKQMEKGEWDEWNTPRKYKHLDGKGRKLILYDSKQKALTVEAEIQKVEKMKRVKAYPWKNKKDEYIDYHNSVIYNETGEINEPESPI